MEADERRCPRQGTQVVAKTVDDAVVLLDLTTEMYYSLNEVGSRIWALADGRRSVATIVDTLAGEFDAERGQIREDAEDLLSQLAAEGLITWDAS
jgi:hypothetical protein